MQVCSLHAGMSRLTVTLSGDLSGMLPARGDEPKPKTITNAQLAYAPCTRG